MDNYLYENQRIYCQDNNLPFFASSSCNHNNSWHTENKGKLQTLTEILEEKYGKEDAFLIASATHITSCPGCCKSWCD